MGTPSASLQRLFPPCLNRQQTHRDKRSENQTTTCIHGRIRIRVAGINSYKRRTQTRDTIQAARDSGAGATVRGGEDLGRVGVQDAVHDVLEKGLETGAEELDLGVCRGGEAEEDDAREEGGDGHRAFASDVRDVDCEAGEDGAGDADDGGDGVVAVDLDLVSDS